MEREGKGKGREGEVKEGGRKGKGKGKEGILCSKNSNYLAFQSFDLELPDECYSRNVHVH